MATRVVQFILDLKGNADQQAKSTGTSLAGLASKATLVTGAMAAMGGVVIGAAAALNSFLNSMTDIIDETNTLAQATGFATEDIAGLRQMAVATGKSLSDVVPEKLAEQLLKAQQGSARAVRAFDALNNASGQTVDIQADVGTVLRQSIDALAAIEDPTLRAGIAAQVGGKQFGQLLSAVGDSATFDAFVAQAERFGVKVGDDAVRAASEWQAANASLSLSFDFAKQSLLDAFGFGTASELVNNFASAFVTMTQLVRSFVSDWVERAGFFVAAGESLIGGFTTFFSNAADLWTSTFSDQIGFAVAALNTLSDAGMVVVNALVDGFSKAFAGIGKFIADAIEGWIGLMRLIPGVGPLIDGAIGAAQNLGKAFALPTTLVGELAADAAATRREFEALAGAVAPGAGGGAAGPTGPGAAGIAAAEAIAEAQKAAEKEAERLAKEAEKAAEKLAKEAEKQRQEQIKLAQTIANETTSSVMALEKLGTDLERQMGPSVLGQSIGLAMAGAFGLLANAFVQLPDLIGGLSDFTMGILESVNSFGDRLRTALADTLPSIIGTVVPDILMGLVGVLADLPGILVDAIPALVASLWELFLALPGILLNTFVETLLLIPQLIVESIKAIPPDIGRAVAEALGKIPKKVGEFIGPEGGILGTQLGAQADTKKLFGINLPFLDVGGTVTKTGLAVVHAGEEFSGVGSNRRDMGGGMSIGTLNVNGVQNPRQFVDQLNQLLGVNGLNLPPLQGFTP